ncbi:sigma-70 family RNA polymerase sigma factor [Alicyclobacillus tolerans]|uniref:RNA polymerase sigma factor, sigma-70 family n=1 Tax=Alicyclobacillus tolerans TaxID=90970 RepID=A0A1M6WIW8_9BACL|nr:sigma-70 family RNA polymerase sigma factor [Alicyclobacillus montanus]SHK93658.1 RNA polymerase sigma factor, sigma-70 family [Alicyclobacillus montanus]
MTTYTPEQEVAWIRKIIRHVAAHTRNKYKRWSREDLILNAANAEGEEFIQTIPDLLAEHSNREMEWFSGLSEREKTILYGLYWERKNQRELSRQIGIAQTTISHIHRQAIRKLKEQIQNEG